MTIATYSRWTSLCQTAGLSVASHSWHERLIAAWTEPQRHYHNLTHLEECLAQFDEAAGLCGAPHAVELALWFHDAVYDPKAPDNEEKSAQLADTFLDGNAGDSALKMEVATLILATKTHQAHGNGDSEVMLDIDLSILGVGRERFMQYEEAIRREYAWVPWETYAEKRSAVLESFLGRETIYQTALFRDRSEAQARENLRWAMAGLASEGA